MLPVAAAIGLLLRHPVEHLVRTKTPQIHRHQHSDRHNSPPPTQKKKKTTPPKPQNRNPPQPHTRDRDPPPRRWIKKKTRERRNAHPATREGRIGGERRASLETAGLNRIRPEADEEESLPDLSRIYSSTPPLPSSHHDASRSSAHTHKHAPTATNRASLALPLIDLPNSTINSSHSKSEARFAKRKKKNNLVTIN